MKMNAVGASGRSPVSDFRLTSAGDLPVAATILLFSKQSFRRCSLMPAVGKANKQKLRADLVILGAGGAGLAAAVEAAEKGAASIIVVEKRHSLGGNTALAGGLFGCESLVQLREKVVADKDDLFRKAMDWAHWNRVDPAILRAFINKSGDTVRWLEGKGLKFDLIRLYPDQNPPVQHNPKGNGARLIKVLAQECRDRGVSILLRSSGKKIIRGQQGKVAGVLVVKSGAKIEIESRSVIIATGGFAGNQDLLRKYCSSYYDGMPISGLSLTGDGLTMAAEAGAAIEAFATMIKEGPRLDLHSWPLMTFERDPATIWVNSEGKRFIDETAGYHVFESVNAMLRQPGKISYALLDTALGNRFEEKMPGLKKALQRESNKDRVKISNSWDGIAEWIGADPQVLNGTIAQYNAFCRQGYDEHFAKERRYLIPLYNEPFYAIRGLPVLLDTIGGIKINERMEVLNTQNKIIPGLYAAGVATSGWESETYCSALSASAFGFAINSGRIAGENAMRFSAIS
jgi:fumarate reductase flavoprotein subunit